MSVEIPFLGLGKEFQHSSLVLIYTLQYISCWSLSKYLRGYYSAGKSNRTPHWNRLVHKNLNSSRVPPWHRRLHTNKLTTNCLTLGSTRQSSFFPPSSSNLLLQWRPSCFHYSLSEHYARSCIIKPINFVYRFCAWS